MGILVRSSTSGANAMEYRQTSLVMYYHAFLCSTSAESHIQSTDKQGHFLVVTITAREMRKKKPQKELYTTNK